MAGVNKVILIGRLGRDPELKTFTNGGKIANFSIATSETWKDKTTGDKKESTEWHNIVAQNAFADLAANYLHKGDNVYIEGKLKTRSWEKDNITRYATEIIVTSINFIGGKQSDSAGGHSSAQASTPVQQPSTTSSVTDDLPF